MRKLGRWTAGQRSVEAPHVVRSRTDFARSIFGLKSACAYPDSCYVKYTGKHRRASGSGLRTVLLAGAGTALSFALGQGTAAAEPAKELRDPFAPVVASSDTEAAFGPAAPTGTTTPGNAVRNGERTSIFDMPAGMETVPAMSEPAATPVDSRVAAPVAAPVDTVAPATPVATQTGIAPIVRPSTGYLVTYVRAATYCPTAGWNVLAALGQVESAHGRYQGPSPHGAVGPAQFLPSTWEGMVSSGRAVDGNGDGRFDITNPDDAFGTAAVKLCDDGARTPVGILAALHRYNHSSEYVRQVAGLSRAYASEYPSLPPGLSAPVWDPVGEVAPAASTADAAPASASAEAVIRTAKTYLGVPYVWGGTNPRIGLDCSGLVQLVYGKHGVELPRVSRDQARVGTAVVDLAHARPGDLVAFNSPVSHIGIYLGNGLMLHAPRPGRSVEIAPVRGPPSEIRRVLTNAATSSSIASATASFTAVRFGLFNSIAMPVGPATSAVSATDDAPSLAYILGPAHPSEARTSVERTDVVAGQDAGRTVVVKAGDSLWSLAERLAGDGSDWRTFASINADVLDGGPGELRVGLTLTLPAGWPAL